MSDRPCPQPRWTMTPGGPCWSLGSFGSLVGSVFSSSPVLVVTVRAMVMESLVRLLVLRPLGAWCVVRPTGSCITRPCPHGSLLFLALGPPSASCCCLLLDVVRAGPSPSPSPRTTPLAILAACAPAALLLLLLGIALLEVSTAGHIMTFRFVVTLALRTRSLALAILQSHCQRLSPPWCFVRAKLTITASPPAWSCSLSQR